MRVRHTEEVIKQIQEIEEKRRQERREFLEEGERMRAQHAEQEARIAAIKDRKLSELQRVGIPAKYRAELVRMKVTGGH